MFTATHKRGLQGLMLSVLLVIGSAVRAETVGEVLKYKEAPAGVVFEIVSADRSRLQKVLPGVRRDIDRLRKRFKGLPIAVVSHGQEQFALTQKNRGKHKATQEQVRSLVRDDKVDFHVCGAYASWHNVDEKEFPEYVDVAPEGPAQIRNYVEFGYVKVLVK